VVFCGSGSRSGRTRGRPAFDIGTPLWYAAEGLPPGGRDTFAEIDPRSGHRMIKVFRLALLVAGLALAGFLFYRHSGAIAASLARVGPGGLALYLFGSFLAGVLNAAGWRLLFMDGQPPVGFWRLFSVRLAGEAVNKVTPLASMGGEPVKAYLLARGGASPRDALASVAVAKNAITLAQIAFIFFAIALAFHGYPGREGLLAGLAAFPALILGALAVAAVLDLRLRRRKVGRDTRSEPGIPAEEAKQPWHRLADPLRRSAAAMWAQVADFYWTNPRRSALAVGLFFLAWGAGALEVLAGAHALGVPFSFRDALVLEGLLVSVNMATFFVPANAGAQEGGYALLAPLVGLATPVGMALAVLRRCRDMVWIGFGLVYLSLAGGGGRSPAGEPADVS
jgi:glycosyltransferase 2 family protein